MTFEQKINQMGFVVSEAKKPLSAYLADMQVGHSEMSCGQCMVKDGEPQCK